MWSLLSLIWMVAFALAALSSVTMVMLILTRLRDSLIERGDPHRRARVTEMLLRYAVAGGEAPKLDVRRCVRNSRKCKLFADVALDAADILRGEPRARLADLLASVELDKHLRLWARRGHVSERIAALEALRLFPEPETLTLLRRAARSRDLRICVAALRSLAEVGEPPTIEELLALATRPGAHKSPALAELIDACAAADLPDVIAAFERDLPSYERVMAARALGYTGKSAALPVLTAAADDPDREVRAAVMEALGALGVSEAAPVLAAATEDGDWRVRLRAVEALGRLGAVSHAFAIERRRSDEVWWVRHRADEALIKLGDCVAEKLGHVASTSGNARDTGLDAPSRTGLAS